MDIDETGVYQITVAGHLDKAWSGWLDGLAVTSNEREPPITVLEGRLDQTALRGVLNRLWDLNLTLISVRPRAGDGEGEPTGGRDGN